MIHCTRGQVVTFLWRAFGCPTPTETKHNFTDINPDAYYYEAVLWAVENGITAGMTDTEFDPARICTRGQVVTFLWRAQGCPTPNSSNHSFSDLNENAYYYDAALWAIENGVTVGMSETQFASSSSCTRGHVVTFLYRTYNK